MITGRIDRYWAQFDGPVDHTNDYNVIYHAQITGHLDADELAFGEATYRRLIEVIPDCMSAAVNLAELERRAGREAVAQGLLQAALDRASRTTSRRHGLADSAWSLDIRCALARLAHELGEGAPLLENARRERLTDLVAQLRGYPSWEKAAIPAHQAFSVASTEQRIVLHAAMRLARTWPRPPPAAHDDREAVAAVEALMQQHTPDNAQPIPDLPTQGRKSLLGSLILFLLRRLGPP